MRNSDNSQVSAKVISDAHISHFNAVTQCETLLSKLLCTIAADEEPIELGYSNADEVSRRLLRDARCRKRAEDIAQVR